MATSAVHGVRLGLVGAVIVASFGFALAPVAFAEPGDRSTQTPEILGGPNVVVLPELSIRVADGTARRELVQGQRVGATCQFSFEFEADAGNTVPEMASVVAVDPDSCRAEIQRGMPTSLPSDLQVAPGTEEGDGGQAVDTTADQRGGNHSKGNTQRRTDREVAAQAVGLKSTFWTIWEDPAKAVINEVRTSVRSHEKNGQISNADCTWYWQRLGQTGWQRDAGFHDFACTSKANKAKSVDSEHFFNDDFLGPVCSGRVRTHVYYVNNAATVTLNKMKGSIKYTWAEGGCQSWLGYGTLFEPGAFYSN
ncbi:MAG: hypothetical protein IT337_15950 [Thermomicrobiales bacterium]|nr:hypothetical protein [Thermomicrobiales bacterium]